MFSISNPTALNTHLYVFPIIVSSQSEDINMTISHKPHPPAVKPVNERQPIAKTLA